MSFSSTRSATSTTSTTSLLMQELLDGSEPDNTAPLAYCGPPIGFGYATVTHVTPKGYLITSINGNLTAPRPRCYIDCAVPRCLLCAPPRTLSKPKPKLSIQIPTFGNSVEMPSENSCNDSTGMDTHLCDYLMCNQCL